jgi:predicted ATPase/DNA-binding CsgD family transcriptional regulator
MVSVTDGGMNVGPSLYEPLTKREQEILIQLAEGLSNQEIADKLYLAEKTVRWYNTQIYSKLDVRGRKAAAKRAAELGYLRPSPAISAKYSLPRQVTPFVGRMREMAEISSLLADANARLVTILAPGGMGKTRLAVELANTLLEHYPDGIFFVPLAPLSKGNDVFLTIAESIGFIFHGPTDPQQQLLAYLKPRSVLLVLDNFEHVLEAASYVDDILHTASNVHILTTSRERLGLHSETTYILQGLNFPMIENLTNAADYDAVILFIQGARRVKPTFELHPDDLAPLAQICRLTAGMPLALELAASWLDALSLEHIAVEIQSGLDILETDWQDMPERHRSIRATFEHTWRGLTEVDQQVWMRLSVFRGGFTFAAAVAVAHADRHSLRRLSHKALLEVADSGRYSIHELLRQFGAEKLAQSPEQAHTQAKHRMFFADFMADRQHDICGSRQFEAVALIDPEFENLRLAWLNAIQQEAWDMLPKFLDSLWFYCEVHTRSQEGLALLQQAEKKLRSLPTTTETELNLGCVLARLGWFYYDLGLVEDSIAASEEAMQILRQANRPADLLAALYSRQVLALTHNQFDIGVKLLQEGLDLARANEDSYWESHFLTWSAISYIVRSDADASRPLVEAGLAIGERLENHWGMMRATTVLGDVEEVQGHYQRARACFQRSLSISERFGHNFTIATHNTHLARIAFREGHCDPAYRHLRVALQALWEAGYLWPSPFPLVCVAEVLAAQNEWVRAAEILGAIDDHLTTLHRNDQSAHTLAEAVRDKLGADPFARAWARGQQRELSTVIVELLQELPR